MVDACKEAAFKLIYGSGVSCLPLGLGSKRPSVESWKDYQTRLPGGCEVAADWPAGNVGIVTGSLSRLVVVDCESREDATWFWKNRGQTKAIAETPRGIHFYFRHPGVAVANAQGVRDESGKPRYDVRGDGGYVVAPPSSVTAGPDVKVSGCYRWRPGFELLRPEDLPAFDVAWRPTATPAQQQDKRVTDGLAYITHIRAVAGQGGHNDTFRAVHRLRDSGMAETEALAAIIEWNQTNAEPPWSVAELLHKVRDAYKGQ